MARKKTDMEPGVTEAPPEVPQEQNGDDKKAPVFKVGPIPTGKGEAVGVAVWANEYEDRQENRKYTVYSTTCECRYRNGDGEWKSGKNFRGSQLPVLIYALNKAHDWILSQRDPAPF